METKALHGYEIDEFSHDGLSREVFRVGTGPAVIVMSELPGITPRVAEFGRKVAGIGCTAVLPSLFGTPGVHLQWDISLLLLLKLAYLENLLLFLEIELRLSLSGLEL